MIFTANLFLQDEMRAELQRQVNAAEGLKAWCRKVGIVNHSPVSMALSGKRPITEAIANAAGFILVTGFMKVGE